MKIKTTHVMQNKINLVSYNKLFWGVSFYSPLLLIFILLIIDSSILIYLFLYVFIVITISFGLHFVLKYYFDEYVIINEEKIIYFGSRLYGKKEKTIEIKKIIEILYEKESFAVFPGYRINVILKGERKNKYVIVGEKVAAFFQLNDNLLKELSDFFNAPVKKKSYILSADLKQRKEL
jgi:hypothetical protein